MYLEIIELFYCS